MQIETQRVPHRVNVWNHHEYLPANISNERTNSHANKKSKITRTRIRQVQSNSRDGLSGDGGCETLYWRVHPAQLQKTKNIIKLNTVYIINNS